MRRALPLLLSLGCRVGMEDFPDAYAQAICEKAQECDTLNGVSMATCTKGMAEFAQDAMLNGGDCDYDAAAAHDCIAEQERLECDEAAASESACDLLCGEGG